MRWWSGKRKSCSAPLLMRLTWGRGRSWSRQSCRNAASTSLRVRGSRGRAGRRSGRGADGGRAAGGGRPASGSRGEVEEFEAARHARPPAAGDGPARWPRDRGASARRSSSERHRGRDLVIAERRVAKDPYRRGRPYRRRAPHRHIPLRPAIGPQAPRARSTSMAQHRPPTTREHDRPPSPVHGQSACPIAYTPSTGADTVPTRSVPGSRRDSRPRRAARTSPRPHVPTAARDVRRLVMVIYVTRRRAFELAPPPDPQRSGSGGGSGGVDVGRRGRGLCFSGRRPTEEGQEDGGAGQGRGASRGRVASVVVDLGARR